MKIIKNVGPNQKKFLYWVKLVDNVTRLQLPADTNQPTITEPIALIRLLFGPNESLQHKQPFCQTSFNVRNQIFVKKLSEHQLFDTKTFNCKVVQGKNQ